MQSPLDYVDWTSCADALSANPFKVYASSTVVHWFIALVPPQLWRATTEKNLGSAPVESTWNRKTCISIPFLTLHVVWLRPNVEEKWAICKSLNTVRKLVYILYTLLHHMIIYIQISMFSWAAGATLGHIESYLTQLSAGQSLWKSRSPIKFYPISATFHNTWCEGDIIHA